MPKPTISAAGEAMPTAKAKIDRAAVMRTAWAHYRLSFTRPWIKKPVNRADFAWCLSCAWRKAREAQMSPREQEIARIDRELELLPFKPLRVDTDAIKRRLEARRASLAA